MATIPVVCGGKSKSLTLIIKIQADLTTYLELDDINAVLVDELHRLELDGLLDVQLLLFLERALAMRTMKRKKTHFLLPFLGLLFLLASRLHGFRQKCV
jgi:hypothetical protein